MFPHPIQQRRVECALIMLTAMFVYNELGLSWLIFAALFFIPDLSLLFYFFAGRRIGGTAYNLAHSFTGPLLIGIWGWQSDHVLTQSISLIWLAHAAFDRAIGWGLKYPDSFCNTDMGVKNLPIANKYLS